MKRFFRLPKVMGQTGLTRTVVYELMAAGDFPKPIHLTARTVAWCSDEIDTWINERIKNSRSPSPPPKNKKGESLGGL